MECLRLNGGRKSRHAHRNAGARPTSPCPILHMQSEYAIRRAHASRMLGYD